MTYREYAPHPSLARHIKCFWSIERDFQPLNGALDIMPDSCIEVVFNLGSDCAIADEQARHSLPDYYLVTLHEKPFRLYARGVLKTIGVRFFAWGLLPFLEPISTSDQYIYHLSSVWEPVFQAMITVEAAQAIDMLQQHFLAGLSTVSSTRTKADLSDIFPFSQKVWLTLAELAQETSLSIRQIERLFRQQAQITPKRWLQRNRFEQVRNRICGNPEINLTSLALEYGYSDQAHLSRDFKYFSNRTLGQFVREIRRVNEELRYGVGFPLQPDE